MSSRRFNKRIEIFSYTATPDGAGGNTVTKTSVATVWAELKTMRTQAIVDLGYTNATLAIKVTVRKPDTFSYQTANMSFDYNNTEYTIVSATVTPDFHNRLVTFTAIQKGGNV